jgi:ABC-type Fe3+/spermidine/putrescine transport system ATPase subunit
MIATSTMHQHSQALLEIDDVSKSFGVTRVLRGVSLEAARGEIICLLGPSGCGKTTLLRIVAGLEQADAGQVLLDGRPLAGVPVHQRGFGFMFQDYALFPHRNVYDNVAFGLRMAGQSKTARQSRVMEVLALVELTGLETRRVHELSGGQQQRVALARSLAPQPALLLLDEPLGSLDRTLREELLGELRRILKQTPAGPGGAAGITSIYVTHDQQEAFAIADQVVIMNAGSIEQIGAPLAIYRQPASPFVARFLGMHNLLPGQMVAGAPEWLVATPVGLLRCATGLAGAAAGASLWTLIRPDAARLAGPAAGDAENLIQGRLLELSFRGSQVKITLGYGDGQRLVFDLPGAAAAALPPAGEALQLALASEAISLLARTP